MAPRTRWSFTQEFKAEIIERVKLGDRGIGQVARDFDLGETAVRAWVNQAETDAGDRASVWPAVDLAQSPSYTRQSHLPQTPQQRATSLGVCVLMTPHRSIADSSVHYGFSFALMTRPLGESTYQYPPETLMPWPAAWPGAPSPTQKLQRPAVKLTCSPRPGGSWSRVMRLRPDRRPPVWSPRSAAGAAAMMKRRRSSRSTGPGRWLRTIEYGCSRRPRPLEKAQNQKLGRVSPGEQGSPATSSRQESDFIDPRPRQYPTARGDK